MFPNRAPPFRHAGTARLERVAGWPRLPADIRLYKASMVGTDSRGRVFATHRGPAPLLCLTPDGALEEVWGKDVLPASDYYEQADPEAPRIFFERAHCLHGLHVDRSDNVWVTDFGRHLVLRFNSRGELDLVLGSDGESGCDDRHFNQPTHACVAPGGEIFVADGYVNSRIVKFSREGRFLSEWGSRGTGPGQFHTPHALALDRQGRLFVSDRENDRVQIFRQDGALLEMWSGLHSLDGLCVDRAGRIYGSSGADHALIRFGPRGEIVQVWADPALGPYPDRMTGTFPDCDYPHGIFADGRGALYVAESNVHADGSRLLKFHC